MQSCPSWTMTEVICTDLPWSPWSPSGPSIPWPTGPLSPFSPVSPLIKNKRISTMACELQLDPRPGRGKNRRSSKSSGHCWDLCLHCIPKDAKLPSATPRLDFASSTAEMSAGLHFIYVGIKEKQVGLVLLTSGTRITQLSRWPSVSWGTPRTRMPNTSHNSRRTWGPSWARPTRHSRRQGLPQVSS